MHIILCVPHLVVPENKNRGNESICIIYLVSCKSPVIASAQGSNPVNNTAALFIILVFVYAVVPLRYIHKTTGRNSKGKQKIQYQYIRYAIQARILLLATTYPLGVHSHYQRRICFNLMYSPL